MKALLAKWRQDILAFIYNQHWVGKLSSGRTLGGFCVNFICIICLLLLPANTMNLRIFNLIRILIAKLLVFIANDKSWVY